MVGQAAISILHAYHDGWQKGVRMGLSGDHWLLENLLKTKQQMLSGRLRAGGSWVSVQLRCRRML
jgi:hypothetical protein